MKEIKKVLVFTLMFLGSFALFQTKANAEVEVFKPTVTGTLTKEGDSVKISGTNEDNAKWVKYVSSTDEMMYVYTDAKSMDPVIDVYDEDGIMVASHNDLDKYGNEYIDAGKTDNALNAEIFIKLKKGTVYYFKTCILSDENSVDYNIKLIKAPGTPEVGVYACYYDKDNKYNEIDLSDPTTSIKGLSYDSKNFVLTMNNCNLEYELFACVESHNVLADSLLEIRVIGSNTITLDNFWTFINLCVSTTFTGNGTLTLNKVENSEAFNPVEYAIYSRKTMDGDEFFQINIDGPTININGNGYYSCFKFDGKLVVNDGNVNIAANSEESCMYGETVIVNGGNIKFAGEEFNDYIDCSVFRMNGGDIVFSGRGHDNAIDAGLIIINDGSIVSLGDIRYDTIAGYDFEMNGGSINIVVECKYGYYSSAIYGSDSLVVNDGTIVIKYEDPEEGTECSGYSPFETKTELDINGGNIFVIRSDKIVSILGKDLFRIFKEYDGYVEGTGTIKVSDKANIIDAESIDISNFKSYLEYTECTYDGKAKTPKVYVDGLVEGEHYTVKYVGNTNVGIAKVVVTGKGYVTGKSILMFLIKEKTADGPKKGATVKDKKYIYKVTKAGSKDGKIIGELSVTGLKKKTLKAIKIAAKVKIGGVTYKVTSVGAKAFKGNKKITKATIGKNVKTIGANAFAKCTKIAQVTINAKGLKSIGKNAFNGDKKLKKVIIKSTKLKKIGKKAFFRKGGKKIVFKVPKSKKKAYKKLLKKAKTNKFKI